MEHIDLTRAVGAVDRSVVPSERDGAPVRSVVATRTYDADIDDVWDAITTAERIGRWLTPVSGDLRLGGRFQLEGNAGGTITTCEPPATLAVTWELGDKVSWVEATLSPDAEGGTRLRLTHTVPVDDHWDEYGAGAVGMGWDLSLLGLLNHLTTGGGPVDAETWMATPEAITFMRTSGEAWRAAAVAGGEPPDVAGPASDRCIAAFTGG